MALVQRNMRLMVDDGTSGAGADTAQAQNQSQCARIACFRYHGIPTLFLENMRHAGGCPQPRRPNPCAPWLEAAITSLYEAKDPK